MNTIPSLATDATLDSGSKTAQYLTFILAGQEYGVAILRVQEIRGWDMVTAMPNMPAYIKGVINLRGTVVPLLDLRQRFRLEELAYGATTVVIVLQVRHEGQSHIIGMIVDAVADVYNVAMENLHPPPRLEGVIETDVVKGLATVDNKMIITLDIDRLLHVGELGLYH